MNQNQPPYPLPYQQKRQGLDLATTAQLVSIVVGVLTIITLTRTLNKGR